MSINRARDEWFLWLLTEELGSYPTSAPVAELYRRRLAGDEPTTSAAAADADYAASAASAAYAAASAADARASAYAAAARASAYTADARAAYAASAASAAASAAANAARAAAYDAYDAAASAAAYAASAAAYAARASAAARAAAQMRIATALLDVLRRNGIDPDVLHLDQRVAEKVEDYGLNMSTWHCGTMHCRAGWAITLSPIGADLEAAFGPELAGRVIYLASTGRAPNFSATNEAALEDIRRCALEGT